MTGVLNSQAKTRATLHLSMSRIFAQRLKVTVTSVISVNNIIKSNY